MIDIFLTSSAGIESLQVTKLNFGLLFHLTEKKLKFKLKNTYGQGTLNWIYFIFYVDKMT